MKKEHGWLLGKVNAYNREKERPELTLLEKNISMVVRTRCSTDLKRSVICLETEKSFLTKTNE